MFSIFNDVVNVRLEAHFAGLCTDAYSVQYVWKHSSNFCCRISKLLFTGCLHLDKSAGIYNDRFSGWLKPWTRTEQCYFYMWLSSCLAKHLYLQCFFSIVTLTKYHVTYITSLCFLLLNLQLSTQMFKKTHGLDFSWQLSGLRITQDSRQDPKQINPEFSLRLPPQIPKQDLGGNPNSPVA